MRPPAKHGNGQTQRAQRKCGNSKNKTDKTAVEKTLGELRKVWEKVKEVCFTPAEKESFVHLAYKMGQAADVALATGDGDVLNDLLGELTAALAQAARRDHMDGGLLDVATVDRRWQRF